MSRSSRVRIALAIKVRTAERPEGTRPVRFPSGVCEVMELVSVLPVLAPQLLERSARSAVMGLAVGQAWEC